MVADVFDVQVEITNCIAEALQAHLEQVSTQDVKPRPAPEIQGELMPRGLYYRNQRTLDWLRKAGDTFEELIRRDPENAAGHAGLADVYLNDFDYGILSLEESAWKARTVLEFDPVLVRINADLGKAVEQLYRYSEAESDLRAVHAASPGDPSLDGA